MAKATARIKVPLIPAQTVMLDVSEITKAEQPYRFIRPEEAAALRKSIQDDPDFFKRRPCLVNKIDGKYILYAGLHRFDAAVELGWAQVPCLVQELSEAEQQRRALKDNTHAGVFDKEFIVSSYPTEFLVDKVGFDPAFVMGEMIQELPDNIVDQSPIDNKLYLWFNAEKLFVDKQTDNWLTQEIKEYGDRMTTVFGFMSHLRKKYELAING